MRWKDNGGDRQVDRIALEHINMSGWGRMAMMMGNKWGVTKW